MLIETNKGEIASVIRRAIVKSKRESRKRGLQEGGTKAMETDSVEDKGA